MAAVLGGAAILLWSSGVYSAEEKKDDTKSTTEQKKDDAKKSGDLELSEVQVTGTRILAPNVTSANPINTVTKDEMDRLGMVNVADALTVLVPQNISTYMPTLTGDNQAGRGGAGMEGLDRGSFFIGATIANLRGLDPTFGSRTLTLIDGRRVPSTSNQADVVDLNIIPSNLLERMDVVTGGASATYGSGAMAGVVNLVLNRRLTGINLDMDYGITQRGDGASPHISLSGGMPLFEGKGHALLGLEWQKTDAIRDCSTARDWCAESNALATNYTGFNVPVTSTFTPQPQYINDNYPAHFEITNVHYSQFAPTGTIYFNNANVTSDVRFDDGGTGLSEYALGNGGGTGSQAVNGDGPLATKNTPLQPSNDRKNVFLNFEYDFTPQTTGYVQASYSRTEALNRNAFTQGSYCVRFNTQGVAAQLGAVAHNGDTINGYNGGGTGITTAVDYNQFAAGVTVPVVFPTTTGAQWNNANFRTWVGWSGGSTSNTPGAPGFSAPYWVGENQTNGVNNGTYPDGATVSSPPTYTFTNGVAHWIHVRNNPPNGRGWWVMIGFTLTNDFADPGTPATQPQMGRNAYAFLNALSPQAQAQIANSFGVGASYGNIVDQKTGALLTGANTTAGGSASTGLDTLYGSNACQGFTAVRKVWNPQLDQWTSSRSEPWRTVAGVRGRFGGDWKWESYVQYGKTDSLSKQNNVATNLRLAMAVDAVIDDRATINGQANPTYGQPVCRVTRDGIPVIDYQGRPLSNLADLQALADGCKPINLFGDDYSGYNFFPGYNATQTQQQAIDYAFVESVSSGWNSLGTLSFTTSGTLWDGYGSGPLTGAFGAEVDDNKVDNASTDPNASYYEKADLSATWADAFSGETRTTDGYAEFNMPIVSGQPGINLWSVDIGTRYTSYYNKGGAGTTGQHNTQNVFEWKIQSEFEPFDWVRFRVTRSRDMRAATYRDLFIQQPGLPDQFSGSNPWRAWDPYSTENRQERWGQVQVGNPDLDPEKSDTLTLGLVLSPGGWAQGMQLSIDYYDIRVKDGIYTPFTSSSPIKSCWTGSGNQDGSLTDPDQQVINGNIDYNYYDPTLQEYPCRQITFAQNPDGSVNLQDIVSYNSAHPVNGTPYQRRGLDFSWAYMFPLSRAFDSLPGSVSLNLRATRALEASGLQILSSLGNTQANCTAVGGTYNDFNCYIPLNLVGQIRTSTYIPGVSPTPKWTGNITGSYIVGDFTTSILARYTGGANFDNTWCDAAQAAYGCPVYQDASGNFLVGSVDNNRVKPYFNISLNGSYNLHVGNLKQFQVFGSINNLFDKSPPFTGGGISGASASYADTLGRAFRAGVRLRF